MATKICKNGHSFEKTSDCPVCPTCSADEMKNYDGEFPFIGAPALRALTHAGITTLKELSQHSEKELLALHGFGPKALQILEVALKQKGLSFKKTSMTKHKITTIDDYIASFPNDVQEVMQTLRKTIKEEVPGVSETIKYDMPTFVLNNKSLIYFAGWKNHISVYPYTVQMESIFEETSDYTISGKGTIQFPLNKPLPLPFIRKIITFLVKEQK